MQGGGREKAIRKGTGAHTVFSMAVLTLEHHECSFFGFCSDVFFCRPLEHEFGPSLS